MRMPSNGLEACSGIERQDQAPHAVRENLRSQAFFAEVPPRR